MSTIANPRRWLTGSFAPITLEQLDKAAAMLERLDQKYVVPEPALRRAAALLAPDFEVLEIDGRREFTYETCYFDDAERHSYFDHHQGRRQRMKVRVRKYLDAQLCFVEVKLKDKRGVTIKRRLDYALDKYGTLDAAALRHVRDSYRALYGRDFTFDLVAVIEMRYRRVTLVARQGGERMTIDSDVEFFGGGRSCSTGSERFIVETKSANGNGIADKVLRALHQHPTQRCSKYCVGMAALQEVDRHNRFLPALRRLDAVPAARPRIDASLPLPGAAVASVKRVARPWQRPLLPVPSPPHA